MPNKPRQVSGSVVAMLFIKDNPGCSFKQVTEHLQATGRWGPGTNFSSHLGRVNRPNFYAESTFKYKYSWTMGDGSLKEFTGHKYAYTPRYWYKAGPPRSRGGYYLNDAGVLYLESKGH
jgi:hypothetical protein